MIFTTAYDQYTLQAFKHQGIDYLLKPFDEADVRTAPAETIQYSPDQSCTHPRFSTCRQQIAQPLYGEDRQPDQNHPAGLGGLFYGIEQPSMVTKDQQRHIIEETISSLEPQLQPDNFFRINRIIISITAIKEMHKLPRNRVSIALNPAADRKV